MNCIIKKKTVEAGTWGRKRESKSVNSSKFIAFDIRTATYHKQNITSYSVFKFNTIDLQNMVIHDMRKISLYDMYILRKKYPFWFGVIQLSLRFRGIWYLFILIYLSAFSVQCLSRSGRLLTDAEKLKYGNDGVCKDWFRQYQSETWRWGENWYYNYTDLDICTLFSK